MTISFSTDFLVQFNAFLYQIFLALLLLFSCLVFIVSTVVLLSVLNGKFESNQTPKNETEAKFLLYKEFFEDFTNRGRFKNE